RVTTPIGAGTDVGNAVAIDGSGRIVVAGESYNGTDYDFAVVRYTASGSLDTTFGSGGKETTPIGPSDDFGQAVAIDGSGGIVIAGTAATSGGGDAFAMVRYNPNGSVDIGFGNSGRVLTPIGSSADA